MRLKKIGVAIIGSGNIGTDLMLKILKEESDLKMSALIGIDPHSDGLQRAKALGIATSSQGVAGLQTLENFSEIKIVFDATSANSHEGHYLALKQHGIRLIDLTPAAVGPYVVPPVNLDQHEDEPNINMVTCGGQATIPMIAAVSNVTEVLYAEIVSSISSRSAGPGTRANIDEFTQTTARAIESVGRAKRGKAIIILNPAEPPILMRNTIYCLTQNGDENAIRESILAMVKKVEQYVPGYRLKQAVQFERIGSDERHLYPDLVEGDGMKISIFIEVEGAADYFPPYAGNLDIMTSAALMSAKNLARQLLGGHHE